MKAFGTVRLAALAVAALVVMAYANHFQNGFHFDDSHAIVDNPFVRDIANVPRYFSDATTFSILPQNQSYRPVLQATLALDYWLAGGYVPWVFQLDTFFWFLLQLRGDVAAVPARPAAVGAGPGRQRRGAGRRRGLRRASGRGGDRQLRDPARRDPVDVGRGHRAVVLRRRPVGASLGVLDACRSSWVS